MKLPVKAIAMLMLMTTVFATPKTTNTEVRSKTDFPPINKNPKIQVAILLDVSNSMDGLIQQAKAQLWNMVNVMGKAKCGDVAPQIEIALYEYGKDSNDPKAGYIKQISGFTSDLDGLSQNLFRLTTNGGSEFCGQVIYTSLNELNWDTSSLNYKVIFIAGNEDFLQGNITYTQACSAAKKKSVIVNTIYCGDRMQGIKEHWSLGSECGSGSFTNINPDAKIEDIPTPYDTTLVYLNKKLNSTYLWYGSSGGENFLRQSSLDAGNAGISSSVGASRTAAKANARLYDNSTWDLLDASRNDSTFIAKVDMKTLPDSLQHKSKADLQKIVKEKDKERGRIQEEINSVNSRREIFITSERKRAATVNNSATLETEVEKIIKEQAKRFNMIIQ